MNNFDNLIIKTDECSICFNLIKKEIILNCNHYFCDYCIKEWVKRSNLCPMCRTQINFNLIPELIPIVNNRRRNRQIQNNQRQNNQRQNNQRQNNRIQNYFKIKIIVFFLTFLLLLFILLKIFEEKMNNDDKNLNNTIENYNYNNDNHY